MKSPYYINVNGSYGLGAYEKPDYCSLSELLSSMDRLGVWQVVTYHNLARDLHPVYGNRYLMEDIANTPGAKERVIPALAVNPSMLCADGEMESVGKPLYGKLYDTKKQGLYEERVLRIKQDILDASRSNVR